MNKFSDNMIILEIRKMIENKLDKGYKKFIIYPYGTIGMKVKDVLNNVYDIKEKYIIDNHLCKYNSKIRSIDFLNGISREEYSILISCDNMNIYTELKKTIERYFSEEQIGELERVNFLLCEQLIHPWKTLVGKYSYGPICKDHELIKEIGAFCSFGPGVKVVANHPLDRISTHGFLYKGMDYKDVQIDYWYYHYKPWYFKGVQPYEETEKKKRIVIGNDVWLGTNVIVTNYSNIGNGVIAGAGAVITKDVPDYAVVAGCPARIIRYRFTPEQIHALNKISWWDWSDDVIRQRYDDFYLPVDKFIEKYLTD